MIDDDDVRLEILDTAGQVRSYADVSRPGDGGGGMGRGGGGGGGAVGKERRADNLE